MTFIQAAAAQGVSPAPTPNPKMAPIQEWLAPAVVVGIFAALIGAAVAYLISRRALKQQRDLFERQLENERHKKKEEEEQESARKIEKEQTDESRYLD